MSEPIQSIAQNNYILHNIDAKKLYVQEPLFTANSGDAVYVGWRPDETVLWSGTRTWWNDTSELTLSGNVSDYESFKVVYSDDWQLNTVINEFPGTNNTFDASLFGSEGNNLTFKTSKFSVNGNKINIDSSRAIEINSAGAIPTRVFTTSYIMFYKIVGINRKENA